MTLTDKVRYSGATVGIVNTYLLFPETPTLTRGEANYNACCRVEQYNCYYPNIQSIRVLSDRITYEAWIDTAPVHHVFVVANLT